MITKKLKDEVYSWDHNAFKCKGYWFVLGTKGGLGRAASKNQAILLGKPPLGDTIPESPDVYIEDTEKKAKEEAAAQALVNAAQQAEKAKEEAALSKAEKEKMRKKASAARNAFRKLLRSVCEISKDGDGEYGSIDSDDMEAMLAKKDTVEVIELVDAMGGEAAVKSSDLLCVDAGLAAVKLALDNFKNNVSVVKTNDKLDSEKKSDGTSKQSSEGTRTWNREELSALAKAVAKYPSGLGQRWVAVCNNLNDLLKPAIPYTVEECMKAAHDAVKNASKIKK
jgi:DnaJ family protein C protein 2